MPEENDNAPVPPPQSLRGRTTSLSSSDDDDQSTKEEMEEAADNSPLPPHPRSTKGATKTTVDDDDDDDIVASLTEDLVGVAISSSLPCAAPPSDAIRNIASLLSSNKYKNIVVLTGEEEGSVSFRPEPFPKRLFFSSYLSPPPMSPQIYQARALAATRAYPTFAVPARACTTICKSTTCRIPRRYST